MNKKTLLRENNKLIKELFAAEDAMAKADAAMKANVAAYFGVEVGDEVECRSDHYGTVKGVVVAVHFHFPMRGGKVTSVGSIRVRPWAKRGKRQLIQTWSMNRYFNERERVKLVAKNVAEGRRFKAR